MISLTDVYCHLLDKGIICYPGYLAEDQSTTPDSAVHVRAAITGDFRQATRSLESFDTASHAELSMWKRLTARQAMRLGPSSAPRIPSLIPFASLTNLVDLASD
ncbi:uncharacterized protein PV07_03144 [Cladophialophora immunda]|uniref:Uncharacterized protein n=1 Tax=Cladophialophora immunda TaxID=569365 RepID=A0A0D2CND9_9EURO|nr:uncharacterized protein PV07_03144 [Cladophialophora immunda]KIW31500.1 hypothetical protein PV07_03144 [Cladophialophora immunda]OQV06579.1 hypothetical protein CLAIMM_11127 [Cladophialophora immunda]